MTNSFLLSCLLLSVCCVPLSCKHPQTSSPKGLYSEKPVFWGDDRITAILPLLAPTQDGKANGLCWYHVDAPEEKIPLPVRLLLEPAQYLSSYGLNPKLYKSGDWKKLPKDQRLPYEYFQRTLAENMLRADWEVLPYIVDHSAFPVDVNHVNNTTDFTILSAKDWLVHQGLIAANWGGQGATLVGGTVFVYTLHPGAAAVAAIGLGMTIPAQRHQRRRAEERAELKEKILSAVKDSGFHQFTHEQVAQLYQSLKDSPRLPNTNSCPSPAELNGIFHPSL